MPSYAVSKALGKTDARSPDDTCEYRGRSITVASKAKYRSQSFPNLDKTIINLPITSQKGSVSVVGANQLPSHKYQLLYSINNNQITLAELNVSVVGKMIKYRMMQVSMNLFAAGSITYS